MHICAVLIGHIADGVAVNWTKIVDSDRDSILRDRITVQIRVDCKLIASAARRPSPLAGPSAELSLANGCGKPWLRSTACIDSCCAVR